MSFIDKVTGSAEKIKQTVSGAVGQHGDKIDDGIDQAVGFAKDKTGGKFDDQIDTGVEKLKEGLDALEGTSEGPAPRS